jgi:hypothetical protein
MSMCRVKENVGQVRSRYDAGRSEHTMIKRRLKTESRCSYTRKGGHDLVFALSQLRPRGAKGGLQVSWSLTQAKVSRISRYVAPALSSLCLAGLFVECGSDCHMDRSLSVFRCPLYSDWKSATCESTDSTVKQTVFYPLGHVILHMRPRMVFGYLAVDQSLAAISSEMGIKCLRLGVNESLLPRKCTIICSGDSD